MVVYTVSSSKAEVCGCCLYSDSPLFRIKGLLGRSSLGEEEGILLKPCNSIHMFFMRFPIDAIFLDKEGHILHIRHSIKPWRMSTLVFHAVSVLELAAGTALRLGLEKGELLTFSIKSRYT
jgi:uncharacterized protein